MKGTPSKQIRALYSESTIRVYQAYCDKIADTALNHGTFVSPPFKIERMTWIKPSFLWMMYRSGWGKKESGQSRILAIDITRKGFEWALENSLTSNKAKDYPDKKDWQNIKNATPVRIQWDPERDLNLEPLKHRSIQIGLSKEAVFLYVNEWIQHITDVTNLANDIYSLVKEGQIERANLLLPEEKVYFVNEKIAKTINLSL